VTCDLCIWVRTRRAQHQLHPHLTDDDLDGVTRSVLQLEPARPAPKTTTEASPPATRRRVRRPAARVSRSFVDRLVDVLRKEVLRRLRAG